MDWAIRCFTNNVKDQKIRYDAVSLHLSSANLSCFVPFEYLTEGIRINGSWYPIVKMQWIEGETLLQYIRRNLQNAELLKSLAEKWRHMIIDLQAANIAHGDLQPGNVLIQDDEIKLIDYDGMYVPALQGMRSNEIGHRNYQHPRRSEEHFGPWIDNFSVWVILLSIEALCAEPSLWNALGAGEDEEVLLFRQEDFVSPGTSRAFELLEKMEDVSLRSIAVSFRDVLSFEVPEVPLPVNRESPADVVDPAAASPVYPKIFIAHVTAVPHRLASMMDVVKERLAAYRRQVQTLSQDEHNKSYPAGSAWVLDHLTDESESAKPLSANRFVYERVGSLSLIIVAAWMAALMFGSSPVIAVVSCIVLGAGVEAAFLYWRYKRLPAVKDKASSSKKIAELQNIVSRLNAEINEINTRKQKFKQMQEDNLNDIVRRQRVAAEQEKLETDEVEKELQSYASEVVFERQTIDQEEQAELAGALASYRKKWLEDRLTSHRIGREKIPEVDVEMKRRLRSNGIVTAADFLDINLSQSYGRKKLIKAYMILKSGGSIHVPMSPPQAKALIDWRKKLERKYRAQIPQFVPPSILAPIKSKYNDRKTMLNDTEQTYKTEAQLMISRIRQTYRPERELLKNEEDAARNNLELGLNPFDKEIADLTKSLSMKQWELLHLSKQRDSFKAVSFVEFIKRVFFLN
jgi:hypothetical protein